MNPMSIMAQAEKLGIPELQRSIQNGVVPAFIGVPLLQEKVKRQKQMQMGMAAGQPKKPSVAEQVGQEAQQATIADIMKAQALRMQGEMGQTGGISDSLPKPAQAEESYAKGGPIAFAVGGDVGSIYEKLANGEPLTLEEKELISNKPSAFAQLQKLPVGNFTKPTSQITPTSKTQPASAPAINTPIPKGAEPYKSSIYNAAGEYGIDPYLIEGVMAQESSFDPNATNPTPGSTSAGLGGITAGTANDLGVTNRYDPDQSINGIAKMLRQNLNKAEAANPNVSYADIRNQALTMYNQGPNASKATLAENAQYGNDVENKAEAFTLGKAAPASQFGRTTDSLLTGEAQSPISYGQITAPKQEFNQADYDALLNPASETDARARMEGIRGLLPENKSMEDLRGKISKMEDESKSDKERAPWMALMHAGLATMAGTSPYAMTNIGKGAQEGVADYIAAQKDYRQAQEKRYDMESRLDSAQRAEDVVIATKGYESAEAAKKENAVTKRAALADKAKIAADNAKADMEASKANVTSGLTAKQIEATLQTHSAENQKLFKIANTIKQDALRRGVDMSDTEALNKASQTLSPYNVEKYNHEITKDYENAWQDYLQEKYVGLPSGMNKTQFIEYLTKGSTTKPNSGGLQDINGRKTYVAGG